MEFGSKQLENKIYELKPVPEICMKIFMCHEITYEPIVLRHIICSTSSQRIKLSSLPPTTQTQPIHISNTFSVVNQDPFLIVEQTLKKSWTLHTFISVHNRFMSLWRRKRRGLWREFFH